MKYATFDDNGLPTGFYDDSIHKSIPASAVAITNEQWQDFLNNQGQRRWSGTEVVEYIYHSTSAELAAQIRSRRDALIAGTDYLVMPDYPISAEQLEAVRTYRQALRDVTTQDTFPQSVIWPVKPDI